MELDYGVRVLRRDTDDGIRYEWRAWVPGRRRVSDLYLDPLDARLAAESWLNYQLRPLITAEELEESAGWWEHTG